ncbi:MAG: copper-binding protein [Blastocatellales bacterium]
MTEQNGQKVLLPAETSHRQIIYADAVTPDNGNHVEQLLASASQLKSPVAATEENLAAGQSLFLQKCSACHGTDGKSQTEFAAVMPTRPADLTGPKIAKLTESQIYSLVSTGIAQSGMPAFKNRISDESIWKLALYLRQLSHAKQVHLLTAQTTPPPTKEAALPNAERRYALTGKIVSVERELKQVTIEHEEIKGYMEAMTMPFPLADEKLLGKAKKGDKIQATLVIGGSGGWRLENVIIR